MSDSNLTEWRPPQAKYVNLAVSIGLGAIALTVLAMVVKKIVPTWIDALNLINQLLSNMTELVITGVILTAVVWLAFETISPHGKINKLFAQAYSSMINKITWEMLNVDPISPLTDKRAEVVQNLSIFENAYANFDGTIAHLKETEAKYRGDATHAEGEAKAAHNRYAQIQAAGQENTPQAMQVMEFFQTKAAETAKLNEAADSFRKMYTKLEPVRITLGKMRSVLKVTIANLDTDIRIARDTWNAAQDMSAADRAARGAMKTSREELAQQAMQVIETKYGESLGRLNNLTDITQSFLTSMDLQKATYSEELLQKWQSESAALLGGPTAQPMPLLSTPVATPAPASSSFTSTLIR